MNELLTGIGLTLDFIAVIIIGVSTSIMHRVLASYDADPTIQQRRWLRVAGPIGWALLALGFGLQLLGALLGGPSGG